VDLRKGKTAILTSRQNAYRVISQLPFRRSTFLSAHQAFASRPSGRQPDPWPRSSRRPHGPLRWRPFPRGAPCPSLYLAFSRLWIWTGHRKKCAGRPACWMADAVIEAGPLTQKKRARLCPKKTTGYEIVHLFGNRPGCLGKRPQAIPSEALIWTKQGPYQTAWKSRDVLCIKGLRVLAAWQRATPRPGGSEG
jgi:hypothetical protein